MSYDLKSEHRAVRNRTTPVIGTDGTVYALSAEALLFSITGDLSTTNWNFNAADHGTPEGRYFSPPHSPIIDNEGHVYFVAAPADPDSADPYLFCVNSDGSLSWRYELENLSNTVDNSYPAPSITPDGMILVSHARKTKFSAINPVTRTEEWNYELSSAEIHADPSIASYGHIHLPAWQTGPGIPESILRWLSIDSSTGDLVVDWRDNGAPVNLFSGLSVGDRLFVYPQKMDLLLIDALSGDLMDTVNLNEELCSSPARNTDATYVFQLHPPYGVTGRSDLVGCQLVDAKTPPSHSRWTPSEYRASLRWMETE